MEVEVGNTGIDDTDKDIMLACFKKNAESLLSTHTNLSIVQGSFYKINRNLEETYEPRLVLYVIAKEYIPLGEDPFDKVYDGIQVDVREGMFTMFGNHADDALSNIRMGCKIQRVVNEQSYNGTLGVFFEHPEHGLCGITCAHAILTPEEHRNCIEYGLKKTWIDNHQQIVVYQPAKPHLLGHVVGIICSEGTMSNSGNDVAIIRIVDDRKPVNGKWPQPKSDAKELGIEHNVYFKLNTLANN
ncbi:hypothetical protein DPMN_032105 [Dreissena polymorpha]|uniref:Uncharacterized protein n=1 Tax=Dreissena polymorpha TaxID=45954 RepID=A0A9D4RJY2_DREPO|nr:hypothetical protein DPMN_032105 [Dreissena polymorpha]